MSGGNQRGPQAANTGRKRPRVHTQGGMRQACAESKDVGSESGRRAVTLRRHMARRAAARRVRCSGECSQLEIEQINIRAGEDGIRQFQIPVNNAEPVQFGDGGGEALKRAADFGARPFMQRNAVDIFNGDRAVR